MAEAQCGGFDFHLCGEGEVGKAVCGFEDEGVCGDEHDGFGDARAAGFEIAGVEEGGVIADAGDVEHGGAEDMAGREQADAEAICGLRDLKWQRVESCFGDAEARADDGGGGFGAECFFVSCEVIGVAVRDERPWFRVPRIEPEVAFGEVEPTLESHFNHLPGEFSGMVSTRNAESGCVLRGRFGNLLEDVCGVSRRAAMIFKACMMVACGMGLSAMAGEVVKPLDFPEKWTLPDAKAWAWEETDAGPVLALKRQSDFKSEVRRPRNLAWFGGRKWGAFRLTAEVRLDLFNEGNNDLCIAFGQVSETQFYYAHLGQTADGVHLHIHLVNDADRKPITKTRADSLPWEPERWHQLVLERDPAVGTIRVWFDGEEVLAAEDRTLGEGLIGLGSFDDLGSFRAVTVEEK